MKAKELMFKDWVRYIPEIEEGEDSYLGEPLNVQVDLCCLQRADELIFAPIPLTAEILEKNPKVAELGYWDKEYNLFRLFAMPGINLWTVDRLQKALRRCELNELADNFKV